MGATRHGGVGVLGSTSGIDTLEQRVVAIDVVGDDLTTASGVGDVVDHQHVGVGGVVVDGEIGRTLGEIDGILLPLTSLSNSLDARGTEVGEGRSRDRIEHLEVFGLAKRLGLEVVGPERDGLRSAGQGRRDQPVVGHDKLRVLHTIEGGEVAVATVGEQAGIGLKEVAGQP